MKKRAGKSPERKGGDPQLEEFEKRDLGDDIRASGVRPVVIRPKSRPTSIVLDPDLVERLREKGAKRGLAQLPQVALRNNEFRGKPPHKFLRSFAVGSQTRV